MNSKKRQAQARMAETIAIIFVFFVLILFGLLFYFRYSQSAIEEKSEELLVKRAIETTTKVIFLPELRCTKGEAEAEDFCFDVMKLQALPQIIEQNEDYYFNLFSFSRITINETFPHTDQGWVIYDRQKPNRTRTEPTFFTIALRNDATGVQGIPAYSFGYVSVEVYS